MRLLAILFLISLGFNINAQLNVDSLGHVNYITTHGTMLNDIWGYTDEAGNEYALVGCEKGTSIVDVTDPSNPVEILYEPGMQSIWRDLKTWGDYAYVTTEALNGLMIIDLSPLPASTSLPISFYTGPVGNEWQSAHNLFIDEFGYAYIFGSNRDNGGVIILDVATDPMNPVEVGTFDTWYTHDGYAQNDTMYLAHVYDGIFSIVDITDKANPVLLGTSFTPSSVSHNIWTTTDGQTAFTTDEVSGGYIASYDISDHSNIVELDRIQSSPGVGVIPHNATVLGDYVISSYYSDGVVIHDATYPYNMIEVGNYDTYFDQTTNYDGCWGVYPYFPSGHILATDRSEGLFILGPNYAQACYLEGTVTDASNANPLQDVQVTIIGDNQLNYSNGTGFYASGIATSGTYDVTYYKVGYYTQTISTNLTNGVLTTQDVQLVPIPPYSLTVRVFIEGTSTPISGADIELIVPQISHMGVTNGLGEESLNLYYEDVYNVIVGKWGYRTTCLDTLIDNTTGIIDVYLKPGYYDDFTFDFGWSVIGDATAGMWERGVPFATTSTAQPPADVLNDCGISIYVTGNMQSINPSDDDVQDGYTTLISPVMDLSTFTEPYLKYSRRFFCYHGPGAFDDSLKILVSNGSVQVLVDAVGTMVPDSVKWEEISIKLSDFLPVTSTMQCFFTTSDYAPNPNITEAGLDRFMVVEEAELGLSENDQNKLRIYPNPTYSTLNIEGLDQQEEFTMRALNGKVVLKGDILNGGQIDVSALHPGVYFLCVGNINKKIVKVN